jgi:hypothetical protein
MVCVGMVLLGWWFQGSVGVASRVFCSYIENWGE